MEKTASKCPVYDIADLVGKKWTITVMQEIEQNGDKGFNFIIHRMKKISPKLLAQRLKEMEEMGVIEKRVITDKMPVRTVYSLTKKGKELKEVIMVMRKWSLKYSPKTRCINECVKCENY